MTGPIQAKLAEEVQKERELDKKIKTVSGLIRGMDKKAKEGKAGITDTVGVAETKGKGDLKNRLREALKAKRKSRAGGVGSKNDGSKVESFFPFKLFKKDGESEPDFLERVDKESRDKIWELNITKAGKKALCNLSEIEENGRKGMLVNVEIVNKDMLSAVLLAYMKEEDQQDKSMRQLAKSVRSNVLIKGDPVTGSVFSLNLGRDPRLK